MDTNVKAAYYCELRYWITKWAEENSYSIPQYITIVDLLL